VRMLLLSPVLSPVAIQVYRPVALSTPNMLAALLLLLGVGSMRDCGNGLGRAPLVAFDSVPASPTPGDNVSTWITYDLPSPGITSGTATYSFSLNGIPFPPTVEDLCTQTACPKESGIYNESSSSIFPTGISGKIVSQIAWRDPDDTLIWCVENTWRV
jgi:hypothetical protein